MSETLGLLVMAFGVSSGVLVSNWPSDYLLPFVLRIYLCSFPQLVFKGIDFTTGPIFSCFSQGAKKPMPPIPSGVAARRRKKWSLNSTADDSPRSPRGPRYGTQILCCARGSGGGFFSQRKSALRWWVFFFGVPRKKRDPCLRKHAKRDPLL